LPLGACHVWGPEEFCRAQQARKSQIKGGTSSGAVGVRGAYVERRFDEHERAGIVAASLVICADGMGLM